MENEKLQVESTEQNLEETVEAVVTTTADDKANKDYILEVDGMKQYFPIGKDFFGKPTAFLRAVDGVSFKLERGKTLGVVGESGCGKTTLGRTILRLYNVTEGSAVYTTENANGETASKVNINFILKGHSKSTTMVYDNELGGYVYQQYGMTMKDDATGEKECFENVIVIVTVVENKVASGNTYHVADIEGSGSGYFACGGKLISINWKRSGPNAPFSFTLSDGTPLELGVGSSYIAIAPTTSQISWE